MKRAVRFLVAVCLIAGMRNARAASKGALNAEPWHEITFRVLDPEGKPVPGLILA